jgi:hypothetical protein
VGEIMQLLWHSMGNVFLSYLMLIALVSVVKGSEVSRLIPAAVLKVNSREEHSCKH